MKRLFVLYYLLCHALGFSQGFDCNASMYVIVYKESVAKSTLFEITEQTGNFTFSAINLSEDRHLTALVYNVLDKYLLAIDANTFELIRIDKNGVLKSLGVPNNIDKSMQYKAASIAPDGSAMVMLSYDPNKNKNTRIYTIDLTETDLNANFSEASGPPNVDVVDFATDPITGSIYGFDSYENKLAQLGIGGEITSLFYPDTGENFIEAVFFNQEGDLFGFSPLNGLFAIDKGNGQIRLMTKGPEGTTADGCSCPYTYEFTKQLSPKKIIPCEPFSVSYNFVNRLGIGQAWIELRDTFPTGFEILEISGNTIFPHNPIPGTPKNILALENLVYLMRENPIELKVLAADNYFGEFSSSAKQFDFPAAFNTIQSSDDPTTEEFGDETTGEILISGDLDFADNILFSCNGNEVTISSPLEADQYDWSTNSMDPSITVDKPGWYKLAASSQCFTFYDSIFIDGFLPNKEVDLGDDQSIMLGDSIFLMPSFNRESIPEEIRWFENGTEIDCNFCDGLWARPVQTGEFAVEIIDDAGCILSDQIRVEVDLQKNIYVPNAFSPNGDGINETLFISSSVPGRVLLFEVYNRWGNLVYSRANYLISNSEISWDGTFNGIRLGIGNYIWRAELDFIDGDKKSFSGQVMIMDN